VIPESGYLNCKRDWHGKFMKGPTKEMIEKARKTIRDSYRSGKRIHNLLGKHHKKETKKKISQSRKGYPPWNKGTKGVLKPNKTTFKKGTHASRKTEFSKKLWKTKRGLELRKKSLQACQKRPNKCEQYLITLLQKNNLPYKYVGNGEFILGGRNPDFLSINGKKKLIELFGDYWHSNKFNEKLSAKDRIKFFKKFGFDALIIWEYELKDFEILNKIKRFT